MQIFTAHLNGDLSSYVYAEAGMLAEFYNALVVPVWLRRMSVGLGWKIGKWNRRLFLPQLLRLTCRSSVRLRRAYFDAGMIPWNKPSCGST